jgi:hypothetical protein
MKKVLILSIIVLIAMIGSANATAFSSELKAYDGSEITDSIIQVGVPVNLSIYLEGFQGKNVSYNVSEEWTSPEMKVDIHRESIYVDSNSYTDYDALTILIPEGTEIKKGQTFTVYIDVFRDGTATNQIIIKASSTSAEFEAIPEFPTIALPIAAILGLAFFMQRRKEE